MKNRSIRVSGPMLKVKAEELAQKIGNKQFIATDDWLSRRKKDTIQDLEVCMVKKQVLIQCYNDCKVD